MDLRNFLLLACERNMITNKFGLDIFYTAFKEAASTAAVETGIDLDRGQSLLGKDNYYLCLEFLAKAIYAERVKQERIGAFELLFAEMLQEKIESYNHKRKYFCHLICSGRRQVPIK
jgi:hypothetical protein